MHRHIYGGKLIEYRKKKHKSIEKIQIDQSPSKNNVLLHKSKMLIINKLRIIDREYDTPLNFHKFNNNEIHEKNENEAKNFLSDIDDKMKNYNKNENYLLNSVNRNKLLKSTKYETSAEKDNKINHKNEKDDKSTNKSSLKTVDKLDIKNKIKLIRINYEKKTLNIYNDRYGKSDNKVHNSINTKRSPKISSNKINYYIVKWGNNRELIRNIIKKRPNWKETLSELSPIYNFKWTNTKKQVEFSLLSQNKTKLVNHFEYETEISNKKFMFLNFSEYCYLNNLNVFEYIPFTVIIRINGNNYKENFKNFCQLHKGIVNIISKGNNTGTGTGSPTREDFSTYSNYFKSDVQNYPYHPIKIFIPSTHYSGKNLWIIKPTDLYGGKCIQISNSTEEIEKIIKKFFEGIDKGYSSTLDEVSNSESGSESEKDRESELNLNTQKTKYRASTVIIQKYIECPLLYKGRKFDIRMWVLVNHKMDVHLFKEGHLKTASAQYTNETNDLFVHITNYSLQKHNDNFEKFEVGNEVSFPEFQQYLDSSYTNQIDIKCHIIPQMVTIIKHSTNSVRKKINKKDRKFSYVLLGYDFMIDTNFKVWLIEVNKNPGLVESSPIIKTLVPRMIDDCFRLTLDLVFQNLNVITDTKYKSPYHVSGYSDEENMFEYLQSI